MNVRVFQENKRPFYSKMKTFLSADLPLHLAPSYFNSHLEAAFGSFDVFTELRTLLTMKASILNPTRAESRNDELDLLFGKIGESLTPSSFSLILPWLLAASLWQDNLRFFSRRLKTLSNKAMSRPSLATFRPVPMLRQNVTDARECLQQVKDDIGDADIAAFADLQALVDYRLESLEAIFDTLLKQADALLSAAGNEIQLIIGSVTIQVLNYN